MAIFEPLGPRSSFTAWKNVMSAVERHSSVQSSGGSVGQIDAIRSRARMPARAAGVPSMGAITSIRLSLRLVISIPSP